MKQGAHLLVMAPFASCKDYGCQNPEQTFESLQHSRNMHLKDRVPSMSAGHGKAPSSQVHMSSNRTKQPFLSHDPIPSFQTNPRVTALKKGEGLRLIVILDTRQGRDVDLSNLKATLPGSRPWMRVLLSLACFRS